MEFNALYPEFLVRDLAQSLRFYSDTLGFKVEYVRPEEQFAFLSLQGAQLMLLQDNANTHSKTGDLDYPRGRGVNFSIRVPLLAPIEAALAGMGHPLRIPVRESWHRDGNRFHGEKQLWVMDPDGYLLRFVQSLGISGV
ncbi:MAG: VOC family protein [Ferruginibacter sp.]|nr:VOC family protein [Rhodoferax sp.]